MKKQESSSRHNRSTSRYSINRIKSKQPKPSKANSSVFQIQCDKQNKNHNRSHNSSHFGYPQTSREKVTRKHEVILTPHEEALIHMNKNFSSQMAQKEMALMELRNAFKKVELENRRREKAIVETEKELQSKDKIIFTLNSQNASFSSAFDMLKLQSHQLTASNESIMSQSNALKKQLMERTSDSKKLEDKLKKTQKDLLIYNSLQPRLKELQELQDKLIKQNQQAKQQSQIFQNTLKSINKILKNTTHTQNPIEFRHIQTLISGFLP